MTEAARSQPGLDAVLVGIHCQWRSTIEEEREAPHHLLQQSKETGPRVL